MKEWIKYNSRFEYEENFNDNETPWGGHKSFVYDLVRNIKPKLIVELGTYKGTSLLSMCQSIKDNPSLSTKIIGIDSWEGDINSGKYQGEIIYNDLKGIIQKYYQSVDVELKRMLFEEALDSFTNNTIDILHIDGLHTYDAVKNDYHTWLPKMSHNGIILFHDIVVKKENFGVEQFWGEIQENFSETFSFDHSNGLGVGFLQGPEFKLNTDLKYYYLLKSYEKLQYDLFLTRYKERELTDIKNSKYWKTKEVIKKFIGRA